MPDNFERVLQHPVTRAFDSLDTALEGAAARATGDPSALDMLGRATAMAEYARTTLAGVDPLLVTDQALNAAHQHVQNVIAHINAFANSLNAGYLTNALNEADSLFAVLSRIPSPITGTRAAAVTRVLGAYHDTVDKYTTELQAQLQSVQGKLATLTTSLTAAEQRIAAAESRMDTAVTQHQSTFETSQASRQQTFDATQAQRQQIFDSQMAGHRTDLNEITQQIRVEMTALIDTTKLQASDGLKALDQSISRTKDGARETADQLEKTYRAASDRLNAHLEQRRDEADQLVGLMGERGVTSTYQRTANEARTEMIIWHVLTVGVLGVLLAGAIFEFLPALQRGWNWGIGGARLMVTVIAALLAGYTGAQAKIARDVVRRNRRREMDLAALGPYLASLPVEGQHELRARIADRYFVEDDAPAPTATVVDALLSDPEIVAAAKTLPKAAVLAAFKGLAK